jgi:hypothetical protein
MHQLKILLILLLIASGFSIFYVKSQKNDILKEFKSDAAPVSFVHPGLLNTKSDLDFIVSKVNAGSSPWSAGYNKVLRENDYLNHKPVATANMRAEYDRKECDPDPENCPRNVLARDAEVAYGSALIWYRTKDERYARKSVEVLNTWGRTFNSCSGPDCPLANAYGWSSMVWAAEIMKHTYPGWSSADKITFESTLKNKVWPVVDKDRDGNKDGVWNTFTNWEAWMTNTLLSIAVYTNDSVKFDYVHKNYKRGLENYIYDSGQAKETCRDLWHTQMALAPFTASAEILWKHGIDAYSYDNNGILRSVEYHVPLVLEENVPNKPCGGTLNETGKIWPFYEMVYNHYNNRRGISTPQTQKMVNRTRPEEYGRTGWGTFTHANLPKDDLTDNPPTVPGVTITPTPTPTTTISPVPAGCYVGSNTWRNTQIDKQTGSFEVKYKATPKEAKVDSLFTLSRVRVSKFDDAAVLVRFNNMGYIDARDGGGFRTTNRISYRSGSSYSFRVVVNVPSRKYDVYVTESGGSERQIADDFSFRSTQSNISEINYWNLWSGTGSQQTCDISISTTNSGGTGSTPTPSPTQNTATCVASSSNYFNDQISKQTGNFEIAYTAVPSKNRINGFVSLSRSSVDGWEDAAVLVRFNPDGYIDARNGNEYKSETRVAYTSGKSYRFRVLVNMNNKTYTVYVNEDGSGEKLLASNYWFRKDQRTISEVNFWNTWSGDGSIKVCSFQLNGQQVQGTVDERSNGFNRGLLDLFELVKQKTVGLVR